MCYEAINLIGGAELIIYFPVFREEKRLMDNNKYGAPESMQPNIYSTPID